METKTVIRDMTQSSSIKVNARRLRGFSKRFCLGRERFI